eukprot:703201-Pyramimonas_sp.AAC.1
MCLSPHRGGGACGGARLKMISREKNVQRAEFSASLVARKLDWLVNARPQIQCSIGGIRVGLSIGS